MGRGRIAQAAATAVALLLSSVVAGRALTGLALTLLAVFATIAGAVRGGEQRQRVWWRAWTRITIGAAGVILAGGIALMQDQTVASNPLSVMLHVVGLGVLVTGVFALLEHRLSRSGAFDILSEAGLGAIALGLVLATVFAPAGIGLAAIPVVVLPIMGIAAAWTTGRLVSLTTNFPTPYRALLSALLALSLGDALAASSQFEGGADLDIFAVGARGIAAVLWVLAATHRSVGDSFEPVAPVSASKLRLSHLVVVIVSMLLGGTVVIVQFSSGRLTWAAALVGVVALPGLVVGNLIRQISERARLEHRAHHDPLTSLPNRRLLLDRLTIELARARRTGEQVAVMLLDLNGFKAVNDSLGHDVGDEVLRAVATRLTTVLRDADTVARHGGDEFTIVAAGRDVEGALEVARKVRQAFTISFATSAGDLHVATSIGVAVAPHDGDDALTLLKHADTAMYGAKAAGRNRIQLYTDEMGARAGVRLALEQSLRDAIPAGELEVHYQPQVDIATREIVGVEALLRWHHPVLGTLSPGAFMPLAEEAGLMDTLGAWVLRQACADAAAWRRGRLLDVRVAVNVSASQLAKADFVEVVRDALDRASLPPSRLELELTETVLLRDFEETAQTLASLRRLGVHIAIDDFGTGYSSLSYLADVPFDALKIDRSFIASIGAVTDASPLIEAILALAGSLGVAVVAEGVETQIQVDWLLGRNCRVVQGYLLSEPVARDDLETALRRIQPGGLGFPPVSIDALRDVGVRGHAAVPIDGSDRPRVDRLLAAICRGDDLAGLDDEALRHVHVLLQGSGSRADARPLEPVL